MASTMETPARPSPSTAVMSPSPPSVSPDLDLDLEPALASSPRALPPPPVQWPCSSSKQQARTNIDKTQLERSSW